MGSVMMMAGGTGGHIFPALAVAKRLRELGHEVFWLGSTQGLEAKLVPEHGFALEVLDIAGLRSTGIMRKLKAPIQLTKAIVQATRIIRRRRPAVAVGMGGFASGPGGVAAWRSHIPLVVHEQNKIPGLTNTWLAKVASQVFQAFPNTFPPHLHAVTCGNPVRAEIVALPPPELRFAQHNGPLRLLVLGGSQGARALNELVPAALNLLPATVRPQVRHQTGVADFDATQAAYQLHGIAALVTPFIHDMAQAYAWADLAIARAGALTLAELAAAGLGAILVPYPHAVDDHQTHNAAWLVDAGAAQLLPQQHLTSESLAAELLPFATDRSQALVLSHKARSLAIVAAADTIAKTCIELMSSPQINKE